MSRDNANVRSFAALINNLEDGQLLIDLTNKLTTLNKQLAEHAEAFGIAKGELTLKLRFVAKMGGTVEITNDIAIKEPKEIRSETVMWLTSDGLSAENPKQTKLPLREVPKPQQAPRDVAQNEGD